MKRFTKICLIIVLGCFILGCGLLVGGIAVGGTMGAFIDAFDRGDFIIGNGGKGLTERFHDHQDDDYDDHHEYSSQTTTDAELDREESGNFEATEYRDIKKIEVDMRSGGFYMQKGDSDNIRMEAVNEDGRKMEIWSQGDELILKNDYRNFKGEVTLYCPENLELSEMDISIGGGEAIIDVPLKVHELDVEIGAGRFEGYEEIQADQSSWEVGAGELIIGSISGDEMDFECTVGMIEAYINGKEQDYNYDLECGIGTLNIGDRDYSGIHQQEITNNKNSQKEIDVSCTVGTVSVYFNE